MLQGDLLDKALEELHKLILYLPILTISSDASGNIEEAATPENGDEVVSDNNECVLSSRTSDDPIDNEDIEAGIISNPNCVLADVKLATTVHEALFSLIS